MVDVGEIASDFTLLSDEGEEITLRDYFGKVVLYFYPKDGTPRCKKEAQDFRDMIYKFNSENELILGVSKDSVTSHKKFKKKHKLLSTLLSNPECKVHDLYGIWKEKSMYGRTFMGTERTTFLLDENGEVKKVYRKVKVADHAKTCLLDLKSS
ncbi:MAG: peroxiredoxin [Candidatus Hermodarchaeota archaeon]